MESKKLASNADNVHQDTNPMKREMHATSTSLDADALKCIRKEHGTVRAVQMDGSPLQIRVSASQLLNV